MLISNTLIRGISANLNVNNSFIVDRQYASWKIFCIFFYLLKKQIFPKMFHLWESLMQQIAEENICNLHLNW